MSWVPDIGVVHNRLRLRQLRLMLTPKELGSPRRIADEIGMIQPMATRMLHEAKDLFGVELFECSPRGMRATLFGETLIYYLWMIPVELFRICEELVALESGNPGRVTVGVIPALASGLLMRTIATLKQSHPRLSMSTQVDTSDVLAQVPQQDQLDMAPGRIPNGARTDDLVFDSLDKEELYVMIDAQNPPSQTRKLDWGELQELTWVSQQHLSPMCGIINRAFHNAHIDLPSSTVGTTSIMTLLPLLQQTDMIGTTSRSVTGGCPGKYLLVILPVQLGPHLLLYGLITRRNWVRSSTTQTLMTSVHAEQAWHLAK